MKQITFVYGTAFALSVAFLVGLLFSVSNIAHGSTIVGNEYQATTSISTSAGTFWQARSIANGGTCALGSLVVASSSSSRFRLWNATSTTDVSSTTIANFDEALSPGTYTFDIDCSRGLIVDTPTGFDGVYVVTFR